MQQKQQEDSFNVKINSFSGGQTNWRSEYINLGTFSFIPHIEEGIGDKNGLGVPGQCELLVFAWQQKSINTKFKKICPPWEFYFQQESYFFSFVYLNGFFWVVGCFFLQVYTKNYSMDFHKDVDGGWVLTLYKSDTGTIKFDTGFDLTELKGTSGWAMLKVCAWLRGPF